MRSELKNSTTILSPPLIRWLKGTGGKHEIKLADILDSCVAPSACGSGACFECSRRFQRLCVAAINQFLVPIASSERGRLSAITIVPLAGHVKPGTLKQSHFHRVKARVQQALCASGLGQALGLIEASFEENLNDPMCNQWAVHAHVVAVGWLSREQVAVLKAEFPGNGRIAKPVMWQRLDDEPAGVAYPFKAEKFRSVSSGHNDADSRERPRKRALRKDQAIELAMVEHKVGFHDKLICHGIDREALCLHVEASI